MQINWQVSIWWRTLVVNGLTCKYVNGWPKEDQCGEFVLMIFYFLKFRSNHPDVFLWKGVLKISSKSTGEHPCQSGISIKLLCNFIEITLWHGCSPLNLLHIFRTTFHRKTSGWLLLFSSCYIIFCIMKTENFKNRNQTINITRDIWWRKKCLTKESWR